MRIYFLLTFSFVLLFLNGLAQIPNELIAGRVIDSKSNQPIPFASVKIWISNKLFGVITNGDGDFQIPSEYRNKIDSVIISCIGYGSKLIKVDQLIDNESNNILLVPSTVQLSEVVVKARSNLSASKIVSFAIKNIPKNCPTNLYSYVGYYRDYQMKDNEYYNLNEAIVGVIDKGFGLDDYQTTSVKLYKYEENKNFRRDQLSARPYDSRSNVKWTPAMHLESNFGGNELSFLRIHDPIRNYNHETFSFVDTLSENFVNKHIFKTIGTVFVDNIPLYHITFRSKSALSKTNFATGELFIERGNFAIHKFSYTFFQRKVTKPISLFDIQLEYARRDNQMYLNYISVNNLFNVKGVSFKTMKMEYDTSLSAFDISFNNVPDQNAVVDKSNYDFRLDNKKMQITSVKISKSNKKQIQVYISKNNFNGKEKFSDVISRIEFNFKNITDEQGLRLNKVNDRSLYQFREFFLQKLNSKETIKDDASLVSKERPLSKNDIELRKKVDVSSYWMNTPLRKN
jgi:hypothetical protein